MMRILFKIILAKAILGLTIKSSIAQTWNDVGFRGVANAPHCIVPVNGDLYVGGEFNMFSEPTVPGNRIARFDGLYWDSLKGGAEGDINGVVKYNNLPTVGGAFGWIQGQVFNNTGFACAALASWDGSNWSCIGNGVNGYIYSLAVYNNKLYAGGNLIQAGGTLNVNGIAAWNGTTWDNVGSGVTLGWQEVRCMAVYNGELYVGGDFYKAGNVNVNHIAKWNGTAWSDVDGGLNGIAWSMCVDTVTNVLYVGGPFTMAGSTQVNCVAKWDGTNWTAPGMGITDGALSMTMFQGELYVANQSATGSFLDTIIAKWDGSQWTKVPGPNNTVTSLGVYNGNLYAGGYFTQMGSSPIKCFACYGTTCPQGVGIKGNKNEVQFKVYPNPSNGELTIEALSNKEYILNVFNPVGQKMIEKEFKKQLKLDTSKFPKGIYQIQVCDLQGVSCHTEKIIIQ